MNGPNVRQEIEALSRFLEMACLPSTAAALRSLLAVDLADGDRVTWHIPVVEEYRREVEHSLNILGEPDPHHHRHLVQALDALIPGALRQPGQFAAFLLEAKPVIEAIGESHGNTRELYRSFVVPDPSTKHTYLNLCLMYLMLCEGVFKNEGRLLLGLRAVAEGTGDAAMYLVKPLSLRALQKSLEGHQLEAYVAGYSGHIRNAIAHGHMRFRSDGHMRFRDFRQSDPVNAVFDETWPFARLASLYAKLDDTYLIVSTYLQIHFLPLAVGRAAKNAVVR
jgi:hypothetical protein